MLKQFFNSAEQVQQKYDEYADGHTKEVHASQEEITKLLDRDNKEVDRSGKHIEEVLKQARDNQKELLASAVGYLIQAKCFAQDYLNLKKDYEELQKDQLPRGKTYCCVMKAPILSRKEDIEKAGLKKNDLQILFRLIPCVGYNTGILLNPDTGIPFIRVSDIAEYLGENQRSDGAVGDSIRRLIQGGILWKHGSNYIMNDYYIRCGQMTTGVLQKRRKYLLRQCKKQGKKPTQLQGKNKDNGKTKKDEPKEPQTQTTSEEEEGEVIPF